MYRWARISTAAACLALAFGCDEQTEVQRQTRDLQEAQKNIGKVTQDLESDLAKSKAEVIRLEQKLAMARQGMTDDVLENQKELQEALKAQEQKVESELGEAKREAQIHNRDTEAALKQLGQASAPPAGEAVTPPVEGAPVEGAPPVTPTDMPSREDMVPVRGGPDREPEGTVDIDRGVTPTPPPPQPVDPTGAVPPPPPPAGPPATSTTTTTTKSTTTPPASPTDTTPEGSAPSVPPASDMPPPPAPPAQ